MMAHSIQAVDSELDDHVENYPDGQGRASWSHHSADGPIATQSGERYSREFGQKTLGLHG